MITSPCNSICAIDPATGLCSGCLRTLDEIAGWGTRSDEGRREVLERVSQRWADRGDGAGPPFDGSAGSSPAGELEVNVSPPLAPTDRWWAQRWIDKATPGEIAAMRELLLGDAPAMGRP